MTSEGRIAARDNKRKLTEDSCLGVPDWLWEELNNEFHFTVDVCSSDLNHKCDRYYTKETNGLAQDWRGEVVWCHPLFDRQIVQWVEKALRSINTTTVFLLPVSTDTRWFSLIWDHTTHRPRDENISIRFMPKRLRYKPAESYAAFSSLVIVIKR